MNQKILMGIIRPVQGLIALCAAISLSGCTDNVDTNGAASHGAQYPQLAQNSAQKVPEYTATYDGKTIKVLPFMVKRMIDDEKVEENHDDLLAKSKLVTITSGTDELVIDLESGYGRARTNGAIKSLRIHKLFLGYLKDSFEKNQSLTEQRQLWHWFSYPRSYTITSDGYRDADGIFHPLTTLTIGAFVQDILAQDERESDRHFLLSFGYLYQYPSAAAQTKESSRKAVKFENLSDAIKGHENNKLRPDDSISVQLYSI